MTDRMPWFKCYPEKLLGAMSMMKPDEQLIYVIVLLRIYETGGKCRDGYDELEMRSRLPHVRAMRAFDALLDKGKLLLKDGYVTNPMAEAELAAREERSKVAKDSASSRWEKHKKNQQNPDADALPLESKGNAIKIQNKNKKESIRPATHDDDAYPKDFEDLWKAYPRTRGTSKKKAYDLWRMMNDERRARVKAAVPIFAAQMRSEGRPEDKIMHMTTWLNGRVYETLAVAPAESNVVALEWCKTATREQWVQALRTYERDSNWRKAWGPEPGFPGCVVPQDLIDTLPYHLHPKSDPRLQSQNVAGSKKGPEAV